MFNFDDIGRVGSQLLRGWHGGLTEFTSVSVMLPEGLGLAEVPVSAATTFGDIRSQCMKALADGADDEAFYAIHIQYASVVDKKGAWHSRAQSDHDLVLEILESEVSLTWDIEATLVLKDERPPEKKRSHAAATTTSGFSKTRNATNSTNGMNSTPLTEGRRSEIIAGSGGEATAVIAGGVSSHATTDSPVVASDPPWARRTSRGTSCGVNDALFAEAHNEALKYGKLETRIESVDGTGEAAKVSVKASAWRDSWLVLRETGLWIIDISPTNRSMDFIDFHDLQSQEQIAAMSDETKPNVVTLPLKHRLNFQIRAEKEGKESWFEALKQTITIFLERAMSDEAIVEGGAKQGAKSTQKQRRPAAFGTEVDELNKLYEKERYIASISLLWTKKDVELIAEAMHSFRGVLKMSSLRKSFEAYTRKVSTSENYVFYTHVEHFKQLCYKRSIAPSSLERRHWSRQAQLQALQIYRDFVDTSADDNFQIASDSKTRGKIKAGHSLKPTPGDLFDPLAQHAWTAGIRPHYFDFMQQSGYRSALLNAPHLSQRVDQGSASGFIAKRESEVNRSQVTDTKRKPQKRSSGLANVLPLSSKKMSLFGSRWSSAKKSTEAEWMQQKQKASTVDTVVEYENWYEKDAQGTWRGRRIVHTEDRKLKPEKPAEFRIEMLTSELRGIIFSCDLEIICKGGRNAPRSAVPGLKLVILDGVKFEGPQKLAAYQEKKAQLLQRDRKANIIATFVEPSRMCEYDLTRPLPFEVDEDLEVTTISREGTPSDHDIPKIGWLVYKFDLVVMGSKRQYDELQRKIQEVPENDLTEEHRETVRRASMILFTAEKKRLEGKISDEEFQQIVAADVRKRNFSSASTSARRTVVVDFIAASHELDVLVEKNSKTGSLEFTGFTLTENLKVEREDGNFVDSGPLAGWSVLAADGTPVSSMEELQQTLVMKAHRKTKQVRFIFNTLVGPNDIVQATVTDPSESDPSWSHGYWIHPKYLDNEWWKMFKRTSHFFSGDEVHARYRFGSFDHQRNFTQLLPSTPPPVLPQPDETDRWLQSSVKLWNLDIVLHGWVRCSYGDELNGVRSSSRDSTEIDFRFSTPTKTVGGKDVRSVSQASAEKDERDQETNTLQFRTRQTGTQYYCVVVRKPAADNQTGQKRSGDYLLFFNPTDARGADHPLFVVSMKSVRRMRPARDVLHAIEMLDEYGPACRLLPIDVRSDEVARGNAYHKWFDCLRAGIDAMVTVDKVLYEGLLGKPGIYNKTVRRRFFQLVRKTNRDSSIELALRYYIAETGVLKGEILGFTQAVKEGGKDGRAFATQSKGSITYTPTTVGLLSPEKMMEDRVFSLVAETAAEATRWIDAIAAAVRESARMSPGDGKAMKAFRRMQTQKKLR